MGIFDLFRQTGSVIRRTSTHAAGTPALRVSGLHVRYNGHHALEGVGFELASGERLAVVGPNGAGKSTLFKVIAGVLKPNAGQVEIFGHAPGGHICIAYLPQRSQVDWSFPVSVADVVMMGRIGKLGLLRWPRASDWENVHHALEVVGLADLRRRQINELSGGQQQRMFIAQALAQEAELMLMDESLTGLDAASVEDIFTILDALRERQVTVMLALHDLKIAAERFERVMLLNHRLVGIGAPEQIFQPGTLVAAYGGHLQMVSTADGVLAVDDTCCADGEHEHV